MKKKLSALLATISVVISLVAFAPPASANTTRHTLAGWHSILLYKHVGPNYYTHYQYSTITGFHSVGTNLYDMNLSLHYPSPTATTFRYETKDLTVHPNGTVTDSHTGQRITLDSWYNPFSWDWGHILGQLWNVMKECAAGAAHGAVGSLSGPPIVALLTRGAHIGAVTPTTAATASLFGCFWNIYWSN